MSFYEKGEGYNPKLSCDLNATVDQAGKKINWKKFTQENNVDLDIYEVRAKYDGEYRNRLKYDPEIELAEIDHTMTLEKVFERNKAVKNQWLSLPEEVRKEFNNDVNEFVDRGQTWLDQKVKVIKAKEKAIRDQIEKSQKEALEQIKQEELQLQQKGDNL